MRKLELAIGCLLLGSSMNAQEPEGTSLFGKPLFSSKLSEASRKSLEDNLAQAKRDWEADPKNVDKYVWVGRRIAYLGRFREAIQWFRDGFGLELEGTNVSTKLARHLGHRYISLRLFDEADALFGKYVGRLAQENDEIEPDGLPNAKNIPIGTVHSNFSYHHGLAQFLQGKFRKAAETYEASKRFNDNPDRLVSTSYWLALCYAKLGDKPKLEGLLARISKDLDVIENHAYHRLLLYFKGELDEKELLEKATAGNDRPTVGYGVAAWRLHLGRREEGIALLKEVLKGEAAFAFGTIAAEAELKRLGLAPL